MKWLLVFVLLGLATALWYAFGGDLDFETRRRAMVRDQIEARGVRDPRVLAALGRVPRHSFVPLPVKLLAYDDHPLPIGEGQTISQPYIVALMTERLAAAPGWKVLEIGTGSGYQAAILAELVATVHTIEIVPALARKARATLDQLGYRNVHVHEGDGWKGLPAQAPFDGIVVTCAPETVPSALVQQLRQGGRMVLPVGTQDSGQRLVVLTKQGDRVVEEAVEDVLFVPMVHGPAGPSPSIGTPPPASRR